MTDFEKARRILEPFDGQQLDAGDISQDSAWNVLRDEIAEGIARAEKVIEASRRHIRSFEPGTLIGSELSLACELRDLDGDIWEPWCVPGELEYGRPSAPERDGNGND